jgi:hypothetical protein
MWRSPTPPTPGAVTLYMAATHAQPAWGHATRLVVKTAYPWTYATPSSAWTAQTSIWLAKQSTPLADDNSPSPTQDSWSHLKFREDGWRFHAIITNVPKTFMSAVSVELHHRLRGGVPEDAIRGLKSGFGMNHAPVAGFFGNWLWWHAAALACNVARWLRVLALPRSWHRIRSKRLRFGLLNVPARVTRSARRVHLRLARTYQHADTFINALERIRALPAFA